MNHSTRNERSARGGEVSKAPSSRIADSISSEIGRMAESELLACLEQLAEDIHKSREIMDPKEAAEFLRLSYDQFRRLAPSLPRYPVTGNKYVYLRSELLGWLKEKRDLGDANATPTELHDVSPPRAVGDNKG